MQYGIQQHPIKKRQTHQVHCLSVFSYSMTVSTSMSQLNNRYQNETISSLNNVNNLLMTDKSNQNGPSLRRFDNGMFFFI